MTVPFCISVLQLSMEPVRETVRMAQACEAAGFDVFWLAEAYPWWRKHSFESRSSTAITAIIAHETRRIGVGWGIISPYTRHPVQIAMEARVMQELAGERFRLGLGASKIFMREIGEGEGRKGAGPAVAMRESFQIVRGMLDGQAMQYTGKVFSADVPAVQRDAKHSNAKTPFYLAATGPVLQRMAGEISDGLLTASISTPEFVRYSRGNMEQGARAAGRNPAQVEVGSVIVGSIARDAGRGRDGAREMAAMYLANKVQNIRASADTLLQAAGLSLDEIRPIAEAMERGGRKAAARAVSDEVFEKVRAIAGTPQECVDRIEEFRRAGCTHIMLELWGDDREEQARLFGEAVLPHFKR